MKVDLSVEMAENGFILRIDQTTVICRNQKEIARTIINYINNANQLPQALPYPSDKTERCKLIMGNPEAIARRRAVIEKYSKKRSDSK